MAKLSCNMSKGGSEGELDPYDHLNDHVKHRPLLILPVTIESFFQGEFQQGEETP